MADTGREGPATGIQSKRSSSSYVGNYIYEPRGTGAWYGYHKRQKTTTRSAKHAHARNNKSRNPSGNSNEDSALAQSSESGYDTNGDASTPRKTRESELGEGFDQKFPASDLQAGGGGGEVKDGSSDGKSDSKETSTGMQKVLRDLNRCDVSLQKYRNSLQQNCTDGESKIKEIFSVLDGHLKTREQDLVHELEDIRRTADSILQRRIATLCCLRESAVNYATLNKEEAEEVRMQIKQFVTDRNVDEEIGTIRRFEGDLDDILPQVMGFGRVNNVRHLYTEWEEFPSQLIIRSKNKVTFLPSDHSNATNDKRSDDPLPVVPTDTRQENRLHEANSEHKTRKRVDKGVSSSKSFRNNLSLHLGKSNSNYSPSKPQATRFKKSHGHDPPEDKSSREEQRDKYSPEELKVIQGRVKSSLENQGVFLYDPVTGAGPDDLEHDLSVVLQSLSSTSSVDKLRSSGPPVKAPGNPVKQSVEAGVVDSQSRAEGEEEMEGSKIQTAEVEQTARKKKTPTQLRRERKKRQKEREKRQREQEKLGSEESDGQTNSPPPSLGTAKENISPGSPSYKHSAIPSLAILAAKVALEFR